MLRNGRSSPRRTLRELPSQADPGRNPLGPTRSRLGPSRAEPADYDRTASVAAHRVAACPRFVPASRQATAGRTNGFRPAGLASPVPHREPQMPARPLPSPTAPSTAVRTAFLTVKDAADYLGLSPHTLYVWRHRRQGPPSFRMGPRGRVIYRVEALDAWVREQEQADSRSNPGLNPLSVRPQGRSARFTTA
ncbi:helix-turn-helix transcriptional regulator [Streptomyces fimicarius]|uniref:helix-turn-helix transcriptional regulator n=1 Tax=Streptomyces griseus TaxID=1911 RepID=UPI0036912B05